MRACWTFSPGDRISFRSICDELVPLENEDFRLNAYYHTQSHISRETVHTDSRNDENDLLLDDYNDSEQH